MGLMANLIYFVAFIIPIGYSSGYGQCHTWKEKPFFYVIVAQTLKTVETISSPSPNEQKQISHGKWKSTAEGLLRPRVEQ